MRSNLALESDGGGTALNRKESIHLIDAIARSKVYLDYERAFSQATGLPISLRPVESWQMPLHGKPYENPFCAALPTKKARDAVVASNFSMIYRKTRAYRLILRDAAWGYPFRQSP